MASIALPYQAYSQQTTVSTIRVRLLTNQFLNSVTLEAYGGLRLSSERLSGPVKISVRGTCIEVQDAKDFHTVVVAANFASRAGRWVDIKYPDHVPRRTVGWLQISAKNGKLIIVNVLPLETYVLGVVEAELGSLALPVESLKAQIVASRSYVLATRWRHRRQGYNFCDTPHCQKFGGTASIRSDFKLAMEVSRGQYLAYHDQPIPAFYHDSCGGRTANIQDIWQCHALPYLQSIQDGQAPGEAYCQSAPNAHWTFHATREEFRDCFYREGWIGEMEALDTLRVIRVNSSRRANQILIQSNQPRWVSAREFRRVINDYFGREVLKSTFFTITRGPNGYEFEGKGWGHGVGMCQWGAVQMARDGYSYREILAHYYPHTVLERLPEPIYALGAEGDSASFN